jgi:hypothetical protein
MLTAHAALDTVIAPDQHRNWAPYTAWPYPSRGFMVLNLHTMTWAAGPFRTPGEAVEATVRLNERVRAHTHMKEWSVVKDSQK